MAVLATATLAALTQAETTSRKGWVLERTKERVSLRLKAVGPIPHFVTREPPALVFSCVAATRTLEALIDTGTKVEQSFTVRFDREPARQYVLPRGAAFELAIPPPDRLAFLKDALAHQALLARFVFWTRHETSFDLQGLAAAIGPLQEACGLDLAVAPAAVSAPSPAAPRAGPKEWTAGSWTIRESVSTLDDSPTVILSSGGRGYLSGPTTLIFRCAEKRVDAYLAGDFIFEHDVPLKHAEVGVSIDGADPQTVKGGLAQSLDAVFFPDPWAFIDSLAGKKTISFSYRRNRGKRFPPKADHSRMDVLGLDRALVPFVKACPKR